MKYSNLAYIILNYNNYILTINAVENILSFNSNSKIIIVDNASTNNSWNTLNEKYHNNEYVFLIKNNKNEGYAKGNNVGLKEAENLVPNIKYVVIMNPDVEISNSHTIDILYQTLEGNDDIAIATAITKYNGNINNPNECAWKYPSKIELLFKGTVIGSLFKFRNNDFTMSKSMNEIEYVDVVQGCFFIAKYDIFKNVDFFDEKTFLYYEENILAKKFDKAGKKKAVLTNIIISHNNNKQKILKTYNNKAFDASCYHNSRITYVNNYSNYSKIYCLFTTVFIKIDKLLKLILYMFIYKKDKNIK